MKKGRYVISKVQLLMSCLVILPIAFAARGASADVMVLSPSGDTHVNNLQLGGDTTNFGSASSLLVAGGSRSQALVYFDLNAVPTGASITDATLEFHVDSQQGNGYYNVLRASNTWDESEATWVNRLDETPWDNAGGDYDGSVAYGSVQIASGDVGGYKLVSNANLVGLVADWHDGDVTNQGLVLERSFGIDNVRAGLGSRESANAPRLTVTYTPVPEPTTLTLAGLGAAVMMWRRRSR